MLFASCVAACGVMYASVLQENAMDYAQSSGGLYVKLPFATPPTYSLTARNLVYIPRYQTKLWVDSSAWHSPPVGASCPSLVSQADGSHQPVQLDHVPGLPGHFSAQNQRCPLPAQVHSYSKRWVDHRPELHRWFLGPPWSQSRPRHTSSPAYYAQTQRP